MDEYQHRNGSLSNGNGWNWIGNVANSLRNVWKYIGNGWNISGKIWNWHRNVALWAWNGVINIPLAQNKLGHNSIIML